ncbi:dTMP kinase [Parahaliea mediterranea]|uniref:dTMP kinase n=1 Tax=Parahaliea mediterranea TaxID=651086 RepID=UPI000E2F8E18|nr:dTMP kinase [Parahaliea mediterranea]
MSAPQPRGLFITVEGGEGVGKTTNIDYLQGYLREHGVDMVLTREPGGTALAEQVRDLLVQQREEQVDPLAELLLVFAARAQHIAEVIEPALAAGRWVLCDRFTDATYAYQAGGRGLDATLVQTLESLVQGELRPDFTLLLDAPVAVGMERARDRGHLDRFEQEHFEFFERVRGTYLRLARESSGRFRVIDAGQPLEAVREQLHAVCSELLDCWSVRHQ